MLVIPGYSNMLPGQFSSAGWPIRAGERSPGNTGPALLETGRKVRLNEGRWHREGYRESVTIELWVLVLGVARIVASSHAASLQPGYRWTAGSRDQEAWINARIE